MLLALHGLFAGLPTNVVRYVVGGRGGGRGNLNGSKWCRVQVDQINQINQINQSIKSIKSINQINQSINQASNHSKPKLLNAVKASNRPLISHLNASLALEHRLVGRPRGERDVDERGDEVGGLAAVAGASVVEGTHLGGGATRVASLVLGSPAVIAGGCVHAVLPVDGPLHEDQDDHVPVLFLWVVQRTRYKENDVI